MTKVSRVLKTDLVGVDAVDTVHNRIHAGEFFTTQIFDEALADDGALELLIRVSSIISAHTRFRIGSGGDAIGRLFENTTFSDPGTPLTPQNRNRFATNIPETLISSAPTITADGDELDVEFLPGGGPFLSAGSSDEFYKEWVLKTNTNYLGRLTNISGAAQPTIVEVNFYEPLSGVKR